MQAMRKSIEISLTEKNWESIKEFAQLDGVFVIDETGIIHAAGRYLDVDGKKILTLKKDLEGAMFQLRPSAGIR